MKNKLTLFTVLFLSFQVWATPAQIIIVRHGEKLDDQHNDLSPQGCERAFQLTNFFKNYQQVVAIYAQGVKKATSSIRPLETIAPTAKMLSLKINNSFLRDDVSGISHEILTSSAYQGKTVLIVWEHSAILDLAPALGVRLAANLQKWPDSIFDQAWVITYQNSDPKKASLQIVAETVLPTDITSNQSGISNWGREPLPENNRVVVPNEIINNCAAGNRSLDQIVQLLVTKPLPKN